MMPPVSASNLKKESAFSVASEESKKAPKPSWEVHLKPPQLLVMWSTIAGCLVVCFLFGFYAGRAEGIKSALRDSNSSNTAVRHPISRPIVANVGSNNLVAKSKVQAALNISKESTSAPKAQKKDPNNTPAAKIDFEIQNNLKPAWYVQVNAVRSETEASSFWNKYSSLTPLVVEKARTGNLEYFRILSGPFKTEVEASRAMKDLEKKVESKVFIREVK